MSASFVAASSQYLLNSSAIVSGYPYTAGAWVCPTVLGTSKSIIDVRNSGSTGNSFLVSIDSSNQWRMVAGDSGGGAGLNIGTVTANQWAFVLARFIASDNRRLAVLQFDGSIAHGQSTTVKSPTGLNRSQIGAATNPPINFMQGQIAEIWYTNTDIQPDGAQLQNSTLRQLAFNGPFSLPHIAKDIVEYRSFRSRLDSRQDTPEEVYHRGLRQTWTNTNGVTLGPHPPAVENQEGPLGVYTPPMVLV